MNKILIVEDDDLQVFLMKKVLEKDGYEVVSLKNSLQFEETLNKTQPDLIIFDLNLPQCSGLSLIHDLYNSPTMNHIPFIVVTASSISGIKISLIEHGCLGYIEKPFLFDELRNLINGILIAS